MELDGEYLIINNKISRHAPLITGPRAFARNLPT
jgi:hypothetical protein